ncbi:MAG: hypothetical protein HQ507_13190 [Candidatus Marinimicrobia bacterium]|nr:hypothetical protein [Candidatus Neomarinimicrobiota bacterium]
MLNHEIKSIWQTKNRLDFRRFGITMGVVLLLLGLVFTYFSLPHSREIMSIGSLFMVLAILIPIALRPFFAIWMSLAILLGFFMTRILLGIIFFLIFAPVGLIFRLIHKELLDESIEREAKSYWKPRKPETYAPEMSEKQS